MMKVRILDQCEFYDGEVSMREARRLTAIDHARCAEPQVASRLMACASPAGEAR